MVTNLGKKLSHLLKPLQNNNLIRQFYFFKKQDASLHLWCVFLKIAGLVLAVSSAHLSSATAQAKVSGNYDRHGPTSVQLGVCEEWTSKRCSPKLSNNREEEKYWLLWVNISKSLSLPFLFIILSVHHFSFLPSPNLPLSTSTPALSHRPPHVLFIWSSISCLSFI